MSTLSWWWIRLNPDISAYSGSVPYNNGVKYHLHSRVNSMYFPFLDLHIYLTSQYPSMFSCNPERVIFAHVFGGLNSSNRVC